MRHTKKLATLAGAGTILVLALCGCGPQSTQTAAARDSAAPTPISIIPAPRELTFGEGSFSIAKDTRVTYAGSAGEQVARYFVELLQRTQGTALATAASGRADDKSDIHFELQRREGAVNEEGYSLLVSPGRIVVSSRSPRGLFYGAVTLWQVLTSAAANAVELRVPAMTINDEPRFQWRGLMLDSARHYQSPEVVKQFIDVMALHKLNVLHWHLTDDQAWRLEIKKYPKLTSVGAWRVPAGPAAAADIDTATGKPRVYGGYYSQDQVRDIVAYAAARHITIVPEIETPGHASAAIAAYPQLGVSLLGAKNRTQLVPADWGIYRNLFNVEESTFTFLEDVLDEVVELFPGPYVHVGGDEAVKEQWKASPRVQARMRELGVKDENALQSYFVQRLEKHLAARGRRLIGWDEILEGGLAPNATVMSWRGIEGAVAAATAGHDTVLTPEPTLYFDYRPLDTAEPGRGKVIDVERVYRFDPTPSALNEAQRKHILGVQANIWTEHIRTDERLEYATFPRAAAIAEVGWSPAVRIDWSSFSARLPSQLARYRSLGVQYASPQAATARSDGRRNSHELSLCSENLVISLEDDAPVQGQRAVFLVDIMNPCWIYKQADLSQASALAASVGQLPFNFQIGDDVDKIPLRKPHSSAGELEVRLDSCAGEKIATLPLAPAAANYAVTQLPSAAIQARAGKHDLCFTFTQASVDPTWVIDTVELIGQVH
jgi:hexosaminidase